MLLVSRPEGDAACHAADSSQEVSRSSETDEDLDTIQSAHAEVVVLEDAECQVTRALSVLWSAGQRPGAVGVLRGGQEDASEMAESSQSPEKLYLGGV